MTAAEKIAIPEVISPKTATTMTGRMTAFFAFAVGVIALNVYASQPLLAPIAATVGTTSSETSLVTMLTLLGYSAGVFLIAPLTDVIENRKLIIRTLICDAAALVLFAVAPTLAVLLVASVIVGVTTSALQMLLPLAAFLSPESRRGRVIGNVMSGLMLGILLSRPLASVVADAFGWRAFYGMTAASIALLALAMNRVLPARPPVHRQRYGAILASLVTLLREEPTLRLRATIQAFCMVAFGIFWTAVAIRLAAPPFELGQRGIALFALAGAAGAVIAPIAGTLGDRGWSRAATFCAHVGIMVAMILAALAGGGLNFEPKAHPSTALALLAASAVLLDLGVICDQTLGRRAINLIRPEARGRINGLFTGIIFIGGAAGAALAGVAFNHGGWMTVCVTGTIFGLAAVFVFSISGEGGRK
jgi:predicted MFS family arabinose efflux permease